MAYVRGSMIAVVVIMALGLVGCGGGGGPAVDNGASWPAYTPPLDVADEGTQADFAADQASVAIYEVAEVPAGLNPWMLSNASIDAIGNGVNYVLNSLGLFAANAPAQENRATPTTLAFDLAAFLAQAMPQSEDETGPAQSQTWEIDWTDPVFDIHWTGSVQQVLNNIQGTITGTGDDTDVDIDISATLGLTSGQGVVTIQGYITCLLQLCDWDTGEYQEVLGRAILADAINVTVYKNGDTWSDFAGSYAMNDSFAVNELGQWITKHKLEGVHDITGTIGADYSVVFAAGLDYYFGALAGEEFFWAHHEGQAEGEFDSSHQLSWFTMAQDLELSNGMTGNIVVDQNGDISGWIKDAEGTIIATFSGNIYDHTAQIEWTDGPTESITWG